MRIDDDTLDAEVTGSSDRDRLEINAWYDGEVVAEHLPVSSWGIEWDASRQVQGQLTAVIADPVGQLTPWAMSDPLGPGGSRLQVTWISGASGLEVPLGWYRNRTAQPVESWRSVVNVADEHIWVPGGGGQVTVTSDELTCIPSELDRLDAEPVVEDGCLDEVVRLLSGIMPVTVDDDVTDRPVPPSLVYDTGRMDAVEDHLARVEAVCRMGPGGELEVVPAAGVGPVWTLAGGNDGVLIQLNRSMSDSGVYNAAVSTAQPAGELDATQLVGRAYIPSGPMAWGVDKPFGRAPIFHQSPATTQAGVDQDAQTILANRQISGEVELSVTCLMHPGIQIQDRVVLAPPSMTGGTEITGRVTYMQITGGSLINKSMSLKVAVTVTDLEALARQVRGRG